jgi:putative isomerase
MPSKTDSTEVSPSEAPTFSPYLRLLKNRIDLRRGPFSDRGSRLMAFHQDNYFDIRLAERWFKREGQLAGYRDRPPLIDDWHLPMAKAGACRYR